MELPYGRNNSATDKAANTNHSKNHQGKTKLIENLKENNNSLQKYK